MHYFWQHWLNPFFDSTFFLALTTAGVAGVALIIYKKGKQDFKSDAANTILLEIENAEKLIKDAKKLFAQGQLKKPPVREFAEHSQVMKSDSWSKYRYLFARDLPPARLNDIDEFYLNCRYFDEAVAYKDSAFSRNESEVRTQSFRVLADAFAKMIDNSQLNPTDDQTIKASNDKVLQEYDTLKSAFNQVFPTSYSYGPQKPYDDAQFYLEQLPTNLSQLKVGDYLRQFAYRKKFSDSFNFLRSKRDRAQKITAHKPTTNS